MKAFKGCMVRHLDALLEFEDIVDSILLASSWFLKKKKVPSICYISIF